MKMNIVWNERRRILSRCSGSDLKQKHNGIFDRLLRENGYPHSFIQKSYEPHTRNPQANSRNNEEPFHLRIPFTNNAFNRSLKSVFTRQGIRIRFYYPNRTLRNVLSKGPPNESCSLPRCKISSSGLCMRSHVVYRVQCLECPAFYIGSTIRLLHIRIREHTTLPNSSVYHHLQDCKSDISVKILAKDSDPVNLRLKEALLIRDLSPTMNSRDELHELQCFI
jgi:hypothetical protein